MRTIVFLVTMLAALHSTSLNAQCTAISNGDWSDPSNWSCGYAPGCGDLVIIPVGVTILLDTHLNIEESDGCNTPSYIQVYGTLRMQTGKKINMSCGSSVEIMAGGILQNGIGGGSSNWIKICGSTLWTAGDGAVPGYELFGSPIPLPVNVLSFTVEQMDETYVAFWEVESERNVNRYEVLFSNDGLTWDIVKTMNVSQDESTASQRYQVELTNGSPFIGYFKLRVIDNDESVSEYKDIVFMAAEISTFSVYPNPSTSDQNVQIHVPLKTEVPVFIYDQSGSLVYSTTTENEKIIVASGTLENGVYLIKAAHFAPQKLIIQ